VARNLTSQRISSTTFAHNKCFQPNCYGMNQNENYFIYQPSITQFHPEATKIQADMCDLKPCVHAAKCFIVHRY